MTIDGDIYCLRQFKIKNLSEYQRHIKNFSALASDKYLVKAREAFLSSDLGNLYINIIREFSEDDLEKDILDR